MNIIKRKLKNNHGITFLFALLFMMVAFMVSTSVIVSSINTIKRTSHTKNSRQITYALDSAALMVKAKISDDTSDLSLILKESIDETITYHRPGGLTGGPFVISSNIESIPDIEFKYSISDTPEYALEPIEEADSAIYQMTFTFQPSDPADSENSLLLYCNLVREQTDQGNIYYFTEPSFSEE